MPKKIEYPKLPGEFKEKWLKSLRSGDYEQGRRFLCFNDNYCCLGVAYHLTHGKDPENQNDHYLAPADDLIPGIIAGSASNDIVAILTAMNDGNWIQGDNKYMPGAGWDEQQSFKQIADWIEKNL